MKKVSHGISDYSLPWSFPFSLRKACGMMEGVELMVARFLGFMPIIGECGFIPKNFHEYTSSGAMEGDCTGSSDGWGRMLNKWHCWLEEGLLSGEWCSWVGISIISMSSTGDVGRMSMGWTKDIVGAWLFSFERSLENHSPSYNFKQRNFKFCIEIMF